MARSRASRYNRPWGGRHDGSRGSNCRQRLSSTGGNQSVLNTLHPIVSLGRYKEPFFFVCFFGQTWTYTVSRQSHLQSMIQLLYSSWHKKINKSINNPINKTNKYSPIINSCHQHKSVHGDFLQTVCPVQHHTVAWGAGY